ncbi:MAG: hypothetical protein JST85_26850 [Acidobacteria bacterium]|nr:hypothetical protein [Acidobacteriota bacterium]
MNVAVSQEVEKKIIALASLNGTDPALFGGSLLEETMREKGFLPHNNDSEREEDPVSLSRAIAKMKNRSPEEVAAMRERVLAASHAPLPLPEGKTIFDVTPRIRGEETEEEVFEALERLS